MPALALLLVLPTTWIVDANNGPGTNFLDLQAAIAAAQSGDTILVRAGTYTRFAVSGKALTIRGAGAASTIVALAPVGALGGASVVISTTPPGETFYLGGLTVRSNPAVALGAMEVSDARVVLTDCVVTGINGANNGDSGIWVISSHVHASRCLFQGAPGPWIFGIVNSGATIYQGSTFAGDACTFEGGDGVWIQNSARAGHGIVVAASSVNLSRCHCRGGGGPPAPTSHGGNGALALSGTLRITGTANTVVRGGVGGSTAPAVVADIGTAIVHGPVTLVAPATSGAVVTGAPPMPYLDVTAALPNPAPSCPSPSTSTASCRTPSTCSPSPTRPATPPRHRGASVSSWCRSRRQSSTSGCSTRTAA
jgi:hypothetical protein